MASLKDDALILGGVAVAVVLIAYYLKSQASGFIDGTGQAIRDGLPYVDPTSDKNIAYQGASAFARLLTGNTGSTDTIGTLVWDYAHKGEPAPGGGLINYTAEQQAADYRATQQLNAGYHGM